MGEAVAALAICTGGEMSVYWVWSGYWWYDFTRVYHRQLIAPFAIGRIKEVIRKAEEGK